MATKFDTLSLKDARERIVVERWLDANKLYYDGDHWQNSEGWSGPILDPKHEIYNQMLLEIQRAFVSKNTIKEVVQRHTSGVIGREPAWTMTLRRPLAKDQKPSADEQALISEAESLLTGWWDARGAFKIIQDAAETVLWAERGALRLFVPPDELEEGLVPQAELPESINRIYLHHPEPKQAAVITDLKSMRQLGIYLYEEDKQQFGELVYLDGKETIIRLVGAGEVAPEETAQETPPEEGTALNLSGHLTIFEMNRERLITEQVTQQQKLMNLALTMLQRNVIQGGFLERTFFNAQLPGREENDPNTPGLKRFVPEPFHTGAGVTNFISGVVVTDSEGNRTVAAPSLQYRDPVPVGTFRETKEEAYRNILEEVAQLHVLITGDAVASGESRKQARDDFRQSLQDTKSQLESAIRWLLETVLSMTATFSGQPGRYDTLRANVECKLDLGPISADDQRVAKELKEAGVISTETTMGRVGVDDVDAERERIETEQAAASERQQETLAAAVLNARRQLDGGEGSNGLEQPE